MAFCSVVLLPQILLQYPSVYPTGTTIYKPEKCWNGYTIFPGVENQGAYLIDMNGRVVGKKSWVHQYLTGFSRVVMSWEALARERGIRNLLIWFK